ncbi:MAG: 3-hydroxyacyl-CoA dehydrogenase family protein [Candidatus Kariarchaeaceae archaeon]|jgi:3-hydroxybutyryl-CoA dehydrogenase
MAREIQTILVLGGGGTMGNGIAQIGASGGYNINIYDIKQEFVDRGLNTIKNSLGRIQKKGKLTEQQVDEIAGRVKGFVDLEQAAKDVDFVIEAVFENIELKIELFQKLDKMLPQDVIFASNTSTISISLLGGGSNRQDRFVGMHFFNPPAMMKLCEIITGIQTSEETLKVTQEVAERMRKEVVVAKDSPGFIVNRILLPMLNEAIFCLMDGVGSVKDIDTGIKLGLGHPMGPFTLMDLIGLDTALHVSEAFYNAYQDSKYRVPNLLRQMVAAGRFGRKSGWGFYKYD